MGTRHTSKPQRVLSDYSQCEIESMRRRLEVRSNLNPTNGCIEWSGATAAGYGRMRTQYGLESTHRIALLLSSGVLPSGSADVCHTCDNRRCVNVSLLFIGTRRDNVIDMFKKGRAVRSVKYSVSELSRVKDVLKKHGKLSPTAIELGWNMTTLRNYLDRHGVAYSSSWMNAEQRKRKHTFKVTEAVARPDLT